MKKFAVSLVALAALSTASFANENRSYELRDSDTYFGKYATQLKDGAVGSNALAVVEDGGAMTNFEQFKKISEENQQGRH